MRKKNIFTDFGAKKTFLLAVFLLSGALKKKNVFFSLPENSENKKKQTKPKKWKHFGAFFAPEKEVESDSHLQWVEIFQKKTSRHGASSLKGFCWDGLVTSTQKSTD